MKDKWVRRSLAFTIPAVFVLVLLGAAFRDRTIDPVVSGGLIAILGSVVALFATREDSESRKEEEEWNSTNNKKK